MQQAAEAMAHGAYDKIDIWMDCDPGHDDMLAIILAAHNPRINLLGISVTAGNKDLANCTRNTLKTLEMCGLKDIPVIQGASQAIIRGKMQYAPIFGDTGLDGANLPEPTYPLTKTNLNVYLYNLITKHPRKVTLVATGPFTNFAIFFKAFPEAKANVEQIVMMGGSITYGNMNANAEFNVYSDPEGAQIVFQQGLPCTMFPLDVTLKALFTSKRELPRIVAPGSKFTQALGGLLSFWEKSSIELDFLEGGATHDPCTIAWLIKPDIFKLRDAHVEVECSSKLCDGRTCIDFCDQVKKPKNCQIAVDLKLDEFWDLMIAAIHAADKNSPLNK